MTDRPRSETPDEPVLATSVEVDPRLGVLTIDGKRFPWHIGKQLTVVPNYCDITTVTVEILVDGPVTVHRL